jgi:hypothetical protein
LVRKRGFEPPLPCGNKLLRLARLPVPPLPHTKENTAGWNLQVYHGAVCAAGHTFVGYVTVSQSANRISPDDPRITRHVGWQATCRDTRGHAPSHFRLSGDRQLPRRRGGSDALRVHADLDALLDAYSLLGVGYTATWRDIQRAYRDLARQHHPDRTQAGSAEHQLATQRMARINAAYALIRLAPLRYHPISRESNRPGTFTQAHVDEALRRSRDAQHINRIVTVAAIVVLYAILVVAAVPPLHRIGLSYGTCLLIATACAACAIAARRLVDPVAALDGFAAVLRLFSTR